MPKTKHFKTRIQQRGILQSTIDAAQKYGFPKGDKVIFGKKQIDLALKADVVQKTGAWFSYKDEKIGQGRENAKKFIEDQDKVRKEIEKQVMGFLGQ